MLSLKEISEKREALDKAEKYYVLKTAEILETGRNVVDLKDSGEVLEIRAIVNHKIEPDYLDELLNLFEKDRWELDFENGGFVFYLYSNKQIELQKQEEELEALEEAY